MLYKCQRIPKGLSKIDKPENLETYGIQEEKKHNTICAGHYYRQANTNNVNKTMSLLQTTGGKDEQNIVSMRKSWRNSECKDI